MTRLKQYMKKRGVTISNLAKLAGVHRSTITRLMAGGVCDMKTAVKVSKATYGEVSVEDLAPPMMNASGVIVDGDA